jgi:hypothetical protein
LLPDFRTSYKLRLVHQEKVWAQEGHFTYSRTTRKAVYIMPNSPIQKQKEFCTEVLEAKTAIRRLSSPKNGLQRASRKGAGLKDRLQNFLLLTH